MPRPNPQASPAYLSVHGLRTVAVSHDELGELLPLAEAEFVPGYHTHLVHRGAGTQKRQGIDDRWLRYMYIVTPETTQSYTSTFKND